jgi:hypothetical protein
MLQSFLSLSTFCCRFAPACRLEACLVDDKLQSIVETMPAALRVASIEDGKMAIPLFFYDLCSLPQPESIDETVCTLLELSLRCSSLDDIAVCFIAPPDKEEEDATGHMPRPFEEQVKEILYSFMHQRRSAAGGADWELKDARRETGCTHRVNIQLPFEHSSAFLDPHMYPPQSCTQQMVLVLYNRSANKCVADEVLEWQQLSRNVPTQHLSLGWEDYLTQTMYDPLCHPFRVVVPEVAHRIQYLQKVKKKDVDKWADYDIPLSVYQYMLATFSVANDHIVFATGSGPVLPLLASFYDLPPFAA